VLSGPDLLHTSFDTDRVVAPGIRDRLFNFNRYPAGFTVRRHRALYGYAVAHNFLDSVLGEA